MVASGGALGGSKVDENFTNLLIEILGEDFIIHFQKECPSEWFEIMTTFEQKKKSIKTNNDDSIITIQLSWGMDKTFKEITGKDMLEVLNNTKVQGVKLTNGTLIFDRRAIDSLFEKATEQIVVHIRKELSKEKMKDVQMILLVGGFSESDFLQEAIRQAFDSRYSIMCPHEAGISSKVQFFWAIHRIRFALVLPGKHMALLHMTHSFLSSMTQRDLLGRILDHQSKCFVHL